MSVSPSHTLIQHLQGAPADQINLVIADEGFDVEALNSISNTTQLITNRYDTQQAASALNNITSYFSDFDFSDINTATECWYYRISKERPVCHHILNTARKQLPHGGKLIISGKKNEGIKTYAQNLVKKLGFSGQLNKHGDVYFGEYTLTTQDTVVSWLDDKHYTQLREVTPKGNPWAFKSKPGTFGWDKVDQGSKLLVDWLASQLDLLKKDQPSPTTILDLGCGYGYLSMRFLRECASHFDVSSLHATDNNAAAITATRANLKQLSGTSTTASIEVSADDCASHINTKFDLVLCNPPFHQGFENSRALSEKFLKSCSNHLKKNGKAYVVVNQFIPVEKIAAPFFSDVKELLSDGQFKIFRLTHG